MSSIRIEGASNAGKPTAALEAEVAEGVELCLFVIRLRLKNRMLVDTLTAAVADKDSERVWRGVARQELHRLARQARAESRRANRLRELTESAAGSAWSPHDYRHGDAAHLDRRSRAGRGVAHRLRRTTRSASALDALLRNAATAALDEAEQAVHANGLASDDLRQVRDRLKPLERLAERASD